MLCQGSLGRGNVILNQWPFEWLQGFENFPTLGCQAALFLDSSLLDARAAGPLSKPSLSTPEPSSPRQHNHGTRMTIRTK